MSEAFVFEPAFPTFSGDSLANVRNDEESKGICWGGVSNTLWDSINLECSIKTIQEYVTSHWRSRRREDDPGVKDRIAETRVEESRFDKRSEIALIEHANEGSLLECRIAGSPEMEDSGALEGLNLSGGRGCVEAGTPATYHLYSTSD